jgi:hypothetical protein
MTGSRGGETNGFESGSVGTGGGGDGPGGQLPRTSRRTVRLHRWQRRKRGRTPISKSSNAFGDDPPGKPAITPESG